jgi:hypothetical protein
MGSAPGSHPAHAQIFDLEKVVPAVLGALAADTEFLDPPKGATSVEMIPVLMPTMPEPG